jgi:MFS superfamily sulfate permease-like transporter
MLPRFEDCRMNTIDAVAWYADWAWSLPLIALSVVIHVFCLGLFTQKVEHALTLWKDRRRFQTVFALVMSVAVTLATILHGVEGAIWALAYRFVGAMPDGRTAMLYSLGAMTSYGHVNLFLEKQLQLMGALEALNGMLLFGLTTAFLFAMIQRVWPIGSRGRDRQPIH